MATAGSIVIDLLMRTGSFETDSKRAEKRMRDLNKAANDVGRAIGSGFKTAATQLLAFTGVAIGLDSAVSSLKNAIDSADQLRDASIRLGIGVETLSAYRYAAQQTGTDLEELNKGILRLAKNAQNALDPKSRQSRLFEALGIDKDSLSDLDKLIPQIADRFNDMADGATKAALAQELFWRSGANLTEFLNQGSEGLKRFEDRARELGVIISQDTANAADEFNDKLADLKTAGQGLALQVAEQLMPALSQLIVWATDFVSDGSNAEQIAKDIADGFHTMTEAGDFFADVIDRLSSVRQFFADLENWNINSFVGKTMSAGNALKAAFPWLYKEILGPRADFSQVSTDTATTADTTHTLDPTVVTPDSGLDKRLAGFFSGSDKAGSSQKAKLTEAQKEAKKLDDQYDQLKASLLEQIELTGDVTEVERLRYELANGDLSKLDPLRKQELLDLQAKSEWLKDNYENQKKITEQNKEMVERAEEFHDDILFEGELLGKTREQQEKLNAARWLGAAAATEQGKAALKALEEQLQYRKELESQIELTDEFRDAASGFFETVMEGGDAWDAFLDGLDQVSQKLKQMLSDQLVEQLFGQMGSSQSGSSGGWIGQLAGMFFGGAGAGAGAESAGSMVDLMGGSFMGGMAGGGSVMAKNAYLIGEDGPELFVPRTAGKILPADETRAAFGGKRGDVHITQNLNSTVPHTQRSAMQIQQEAAFKLRLATARS